MEFSLDLDLEHKTTNQWINYYNKEYTHLVGNPLFYYLESD